MKEVQVALLVFVCLIQLSLSDLKVVSAPDRFALPSNSFFFNEKLHITYDVFNADQTGLQAHLVRYDSTFTRVEKNLSLPLKCTILECGVLSIILVKHPKQPSIVYILQQSDDARYVLVKIDLQQFQILKFGYVPIPLSHGVVTSIVIPESSSLGNIGYIMTQNYEDYSNVANVFHLDNLTLSSASYPFPLTFEFVYGSQRGFLIGPGYQLASGKLSNGFFRVTSDPPFRLVSSTLANITKILPTIYDKSRNRLYSAYPGDSSGVTMVTLDATNLRILQKNTLLPGNILVYYLGMNDAATTAFLCVADRNAVGKNAKLYQLDISGGLGNKIVASWTIPAMYRPHGSMQSSPLAGRTHVALPKVAQSRSWVTLVYSYHS